MLKGISLMSLHSIGVERESMFQDIGIYTIKDLTGVQDLSKIAVKSNFSERFLKKLQIRAKSVLEKMTYQIAPFSMPEGELMFFDIEMDIAVRGFGW